MIRNGLNNGDEIYLSKNVYERAMFARNEYIQNPEGAQIDDELMIWMKDYETGIWYSVMGHYSKMSPHEMKTATEQRQEDIESLARKYYETVLYHSGIREDVLERDNNTCQKCRGVATTRLHVHHIHKRKDGGPDCLDNLITLCPACHRKADSKSEYSPTWEKI